MLKATSEILSKYDVIRDFIIRDMRATPNLRALSAFQFLTGARIHECIPYKEKKLALFTFNLSISEVADGVWGITLPYVLKTKQNRQNMKKSRKGKEIMNTRTIYTNDEDLVKIVLEYLNEDRPSWNGELLENCFFNPHKIARFSFIASLSYKAAEKYPRSVMKAVGIWRRFRKNFAWLFETRRNNLPLYNFLVFPFSYWAILKAYRRYDYKLSGLLWDTETGSFKRGERYLYTHMWREGIVNSLLFDIGLMHDEVIRVMGWKEKNSIEYYIRRGEHIDENIIRKFAMLNEKKKKEENKKQNELIEVAED